MDDWSPQLGTISEGQGTDNFGVPSPMMPPLQRSVLTHSAGHVALLPPTADWTEMDTSPKDGSVTSGLWPGLER